MFEHAIEGAASLGASVLVWHGACQGTRGLTVTSSAVLDAIDRLTGMCARHGIRLALENVAWCAMAQTRDVLAFAARIPELSNENAVGFAFDPFQAADANANPLHDPGRHGRALARCSSARFPGIGSVES